MGLGILMFMIGLGLILHSVVALSRQIISPDPQVRRDTVVTILRLVTILVSIGFIAASYKVYPDPGSPAITSSIPTIQRIPLDPSYSSPDEVLIPPITLERGD